MPTHYPHNAHLPGHPWPPVSVRCTVVQWLAALVGVCLLVLALTVGPLLLHLALGVTGLLASRSAPMARGYLLCAGVLCVVLAVAGLVDIR